MTLLLISQMGPHKLRNRRLRSARSETFSGRRGSGEGLPTAAALKVPGDAERSGSAADEAKLSRQTSRAALHRRDGSV